MTQQAAGFVIAVVYSMGSVDMAYPFFVDDAVCGIANELT